MRRTALMFVLAGLVGALVATPIAVYASHRFADVQDSNPFHDDISWLADAGVTQGCGPNVFCPKDFVTREQMAAFMRRLAENEVVDAGTLQGMSADQLGSGSVDILFASVGLNGGLLGDGNAVSATRLQPGLYDVEFERDTTGCAGVATAGLSEDIGAVPVPFGLDISVFLGPVANPDPEVVRLVAYNSRDGFDQQSDSPFHLVIVCP